jgi:hypothetical protein
VRRMCHGEVSHLDGGHDLPRLPVRVLLLGVVCHVVRRGDLCRGVGVQLHGLQCGAVQLRLRGLNLHDLPRGPVPGFRFDHLVRLLPCRELLPRGEHVRHRMPGGEIRAPRGQQLHGVQRGYVPGPSGHWQLLEL